MNNTSDSSDTTPNQTLPEDSWLVDTSANTYRRKRILIDIITPQPHSKVTFFNSINSSDSKKLSNKIVSQKSWK